MLKNRIKNILNEIKFSQERADEDRILIAASVIMPIFTFPNWEYHNLDEVLSLPKIFR